MESHSSSPRPVAQQEPVSFLKALILHLDGSGDRQLYNNMVNAEREDRCIRRALFVMVVMMLLSLAGLGFLAILKPEFTLDPNNLFIRIVMVLGLGSLLSLVIFLGCLVRHRSTVKSLHTECLRSVLALARDRLKEPTTPIPGTPAQNQPPEQGPPPAGPTLELQR